MTPYSNVYDVFFSKFTDPVFTSLLSVNDLSHRYMVSAIAKFPQCLTDLSNRDDVAQQFNNTLSDLEQEILGTLMVVEYLNPQINTLDLVKQGFTNRDWNMTSQANQLNSLRQLRSEIKSEAEELIVRYTYYFSDLSDFG